MSMLAAQSLLLVNSDETIVSNILLRIGCNSSPASPRGTVDVDPNAIPAEAAQRLPGDGAQNTTQVVARHSNETIGTTVAPKAGGIQAPPMFAGEFTLSLIHI